MRPLLVESFPDLNQREQTDDLMRRWDLLRGEAILPALETLAKAPRQYIPTSGFEDPKTAALRRWYELDPTAARNQILADIGTATPLISAVELDFFPREPLPQFESTWAGEFLGTQDQPYGQQQAMIVGSLLVEFGAGGATKQMQAVLDESERPNNACTLHAFALAYLARFRPAEARSAFRKEFTRDHSGHCNEDIFSMIRQWTSVPEQSATLLNEAARLALDNDDPRIVRDALGQLTLFGTKAYQQNIFDHYVKWAQKWRGHADELESVLHTGFTPNAYPRLDDAEEGGAYVNALLTNQGWLPDDALRAKVFAQCVGELMCKSFRALSYTPQAPIQFTLPDIAWCAMTRQLPQFVLAQFRPPSLEAFDRKVRQYPKGTHFQQMPGPQSSDQKKLEDQVREIFKKNGMTLSVFPN